MYEILFTESSVSSNLLGSPVSPVSSIVVVVVAVVVLCGINIRRWVVNNNAPSSVICNTAASPTFSVNEPTPVYKAKTHSRSDIGCVIVCCLPYK